MGVGMGKGSVEKGVRSQKRVEEGGRGRRRDKGEGMGGGEKGELRMGRVGRDLALEG